MSDTIEQLRSDLENVLRINHDLAAQLSAARAEAEQARGAMTKIANFWRAKIDDRLFVGCCERVILEYEATLSTTTTPKGEE